MGWLSIIGPALTLVTKLLEIADKWTAVWLEKAKEQKKQVEAKRNAAKIDSHFDGGNPTAPGV